MFELRRKYKEELVSKLKEELQITNAMLVPRLEKIVISVGAGDYAKDSKIMQKPEVINHIEWLIKTRQESIYQQNAVAAWKNDLEYISQYQMEEQRKIWISTFKAKYSKQSTI